MIVEDGVEGEGVSVHKELIVRKAGDPKEFVHVLKILEDKVRP